MAEPQTFLLQVDQGESSLVFPVPTNQAAAKLAQLIANNPAVASVTVHRVIASTITRRKAATPEPEVTPGLPAA